MLARALVQGARVAKASGKIAQARQQGQENLAIFEEIGHVDAPSMNEWLAGLLAS